MEKVRTPWSLTPEDTLLPLTTGSSLAVQFSNYGDLPAVIHIARNVPQGVVEESEDLPFAAMVMKAEAVAQFWDSICCVSGSNAAGAAQWPLTCARKFIRLHCTKPPSNSPCTVA